MRPPAYPQRVSDDIRPKVNSYDLPRSERLLEFMRTGWQDGDRQEGPLECVPYTAKRRAQLIERFAGEPMVIPSGGYKIRANDTEHPFRPGSDFFWLTGCPDPDAVLVIGRGGESTIYRRGRQRRSESADFFADRTGDFWVGRRLSQSEAAEAYGVECRDSSSLVETLSGLSGARVLRGLDGQVDGAVDGDPDRDDELATVLSELRLIKDDWEVAQLQDACDSTARGFADIVRRMPDAVATNEAMVEGTFYTRARVEGNHVGYLSIAAAGEHATTLHWIHNKGPVRLGDLLLVDAGVENRWLYTADVTRTMPINGRFTETQRKVYDLVHRAQRAALAQVKPGNKFRDPHYAAMRVIAEGLAEWGLLPHSAEEDLKPENELYRRYSLHGTSHMLGLDVHDCAQARGEAYPLAELVPGMCLTIEPGLYFQPDDLTVPEELRGIGVRIEDDVLVTPEGCRVLSDAIPTEAGELEAWMAELLPPS
ncbi:MAG: Xaa-Pro aminopeptidase [Frankiales bacterium]|nr:Xaa-Pro aminopeptidase [Frankiales bacterium]